MTAGRDNVTVQVGLTRRDAEAFVAWVERDAARLTTYSPEGIALVTIMSAIRDALGESPQEIPPV